MKKISNQLKIDYINKLNDILTIKNFVTMGDPEKIKLFNSLRRLESKLQRINEALTNGTASEKIYEDTHLKAEKKINTIFEKSNYVEINGDPRGHSLKIIDTIFRPLKSTAPVVGDWALNGLIAPAPVDLQEIMDIYNY